MKHHPLLMKGPLVRATPASLAVPADVDVKPVPGLARYLAGSDGHIYCDSEARTNAKKPRPFRVSEFIASTGYPNVSTVAGGKKTSRSVHVLVCSAFHGPRPSSVHEVRHLDGNKENSLPSNLCWGTPGENAADKKRHGTESHGESHGQARLTEEAVKILRASIPFGLWNAADAARVFGVARSTIMLAVEGESWKHV